MENSTMRTSRWLAILCLTAVTALSGCSGVLIYRETVEPLTLNLNQTPVVQDSGVGDVKHLHYYVDVLWDSNALEDIALEAGFKKIYYADIRTVQVFTYWRQQYVHLYGEK